MDVAFLVLAWVLTGAAFVAAARMSFRPEAPGAPGRKGLHARADALTSQLEGQRAPKQVD